MSKTEFPVVGEDVFHANGTAAKLKEVLAADRFLVVMLDNDGMEQFDVWPAVYPNSYGISGDKEERLKELDTRLADKRAQLRKLEENIITAQKRVRDIGRNGGPLGQLISDHKLLEQIEMVLTDRCEFYVMPIKNSYRCDVVAVNDTSAAHGGRDVYRLLTFSASKEVGQLKKQWFLNTHRDGSGIDQLVIPCSSRGDVLSYVHRRISDFIADRAGVVPDHMIADLVSYSFSYQYVLPVHITDQHKRIETDKLTARLNIVDAERKGLLDKLQDIRA